MTASMVASRQALAWPGRGSVPEEVSSLYHFSLGSVPPAGEMGRETREGEGSVRVSLKDDVELTLQAPLSEDGGLRHFPKALTGP